MRRILLLSLAVLAACAFDVEPSGEVIGGGGGAGGGGPEISFALDVLPLLQQECLLCHGGAGGLNLDSYEGLAAGGVSGAAVAPGDGANSLLVRRLNGSILPRMPLDAPPFTTPEIARIAQWIDEGALDN